MSRWSVCDDWETAYSAPLSEAEINTKLWLDADKPRIVYVPSVPTFVPPPTAFAPALTILKRPTPTPSSSTHSSSSTTTKEKTLQEREKEYELAKRRIYAHSPTLTTSLSNLSLDPSSTSSHRKSNRNQSQPKSANPTREASPSTPLSLTEVIRKPRGPPADGKGGFVGAAKEAGGNAGRRARAKGTTKNAE